MKIVIWKGKAFNPDKIVSIEPTSTDTPILVYRVFFDNGDTLELDMASKETVLGNEIVTNVYTLSDLVELINLTQE